MGRDEKKKDVGTREGQKAVIQYCWVSHARRIQIRKGAKKVEEGLPQEKKSARGTKRQRLKNFKGEYQ